VTKISQIYKCNICGNIVEVLHTGKGELVCCGQPMKLLTAESKDVGDEKHLPIIKKTETRVVVKVGSITHPMEESHYIELIEIMAGGRIYREFLKAGDKPTVTFKIKADKIIARAYCNVHGLWQSK
jgi:superoxide reductase